ncbi:MAG: phosphohydrolase [Clostridium baratii]|uniref:HD family phosphohydrolase n=1 Tax=Clostridium baratii TaxID=1561 RepID=UPI002432398C|nr:phosphohydrolase [Clostridium baratii]MBS6006451.1 phosphohydrolase [Clostridium baratii]
MLVDKKVVNLILKREKIKFKPKEKYMRYLLNTVTIIITYLLLVTAIAPKQYDLKEGDIARVDIKATRDTVNELATQERIKEATEKIDKPYTLKGEVQNEVLNNVDDVLKKIINLNATLDDEKEKLKELDKLNNRNLDNQDYSVLLKLSQEKLNDIKFELNGIINEVYQKNIEYGNEESINSAISLAQKRINEMDVSNSVRNVLKKIVIPEIKPNFFYDKEKTDELIKEVQKSVPKVIVKKNQTIVSEGEPVTAEQIAVLKDLGLLDQSGGTSFLIIYIVLAVFVVVVFLTQYIYIAKNHKKVFKNTKLIILINIINIFSFLLARIIGGIYPSAIPLACAPMLIALLIDYKISMVVCSINVIIIGALVNFNPQIILLGILNAILGATGLRKMQQRNDIFYSSISLMVMSLILSFTTGVLISNNFSEIIVFSLLAAVGVAFSAVLTIGLLPFLESSFDVVTTLKLLELSNPNNPLLRKLLMEAPGTYHHSMLVANLAEMAAEVELAKEYNLPDVIKDIIEQHHGTTLVKYFYYTMKNNSENPEDIKEEDFKYPGPIPSSKEAGIIMLADSVEAAVRSISEPTKGKIEEMVNNIIKDKLYSGQLDNCDLTLKDLEKIRKCFLKTLNGIYHQRIEYPTEKKVKNS